MSCGVHFSVSVRFVFGSEVTCGSHLYNTTISGYMVLVVGGGVSGRDGVCFIGNIMV